MKIQILGTGCPKCKQLTERAEEAVKALGLDAEIEKITQINDIMKFGVMITPPLWGASNPYPGEQNDLISCAEISDLIQFLLDQPETTLYKKVVFFPKSEWHSDD